MRAFLGHREPMEALMNHISQIGFAPTYTQMLLRGFIQMRLQSISQKQPLVEPLTNRELEVLRLIHLGMSNNEIARELFLTVSTVKTHMNHILRKLDVESRTQALAKSIDLKLL